MQSPTSQTPEQVQKYTPVPGGYRSVSARTASSRNFRIRALKATLQVLLIIKGEPPVKSVSAENIQDTIDCLVDLINELILTGNPVIKLKLVSGGKKAWADGRRLWYFGPYGCLQSTRYANVLEAHEVEKKMNARAKGKSVPTIEG